MAKSCSIWIRITVTIMILPSSMTFYLHTNKRIFSVSVESSARGAALNLTCFSDMCPPQSWTNFVQQQSATLPHNEIKGKNSVQRWWELGKEDGIVLQVTHEITGTVLLTKTFNTWFAFTYATELKWWLEQIMPGRIVAVAIRRSGTYGLNPALQTLIQYGSILAPFAPPEALWVWIFIKGGKTLLETVANNPHPLILSLATLHAHSVLKNSYEKSHTIANPVNVIQSNICNNFPAIKSVCESNMFLKSTTITTTTPSYSEGGNDIFYDSVGILLCAGGSLQHLAYTLHHLLSIPHISKSMIFVAVGTNMQTGMPNLSILTVLDLFDVNYKVLHVPLGAASINHHLFQFYKNAWIAATEAFPKAKYIAFLDEDVEVSRDWLAFLLHIAPALDKDPTLWCVSALIAHRNLHADPRILLRGLQQPGWGYLLLTRDVKAAVEVWPNNSNISVLYDTFLYEVVGKGRECIYPANNRARHYGVGVNTIPQLHHLYFLDHPLHNGKQVLLPPVETILWDAYEKRVRASLRKAIPITRDPCAPGFVTSPQSKSTTHYVFYFFMDNLRHAPEWTVLAECVGAWPYSTQGMHRGSLELPQAWGGSLWLIGVPYSPYSSFKPPHISVWSPDNSDDFLEQQLKYVSSISLPIDLTNRTTEAGISELFPEKFKNIP